MTERKKPLHSKGPVANLCTSKCLIQLLASPMHRYMGTLSLTGIYPTLSAKSIGFSSK